MFKGSKFLIVTSPALLLATAFTYKQTLEENHAQVLLKAWNDTKENHLHNTFVNHIITNTIDFIEYAQSQELMIPVTTSDWLDEALNTQKPPNYKNFNPNPNFFLKSVFLCADDDDIPVSDKEAMYAGVRAFGGQYLEDLTRHTTHLICKNTKSLKFIIASSVSVQSPLRKADTTDIKIVLPQWISDCIKSRKKLDESRYLLTNPLVEATGKPLADTNEEQNFEELSQISNLATQENIPSEIHKSHSKLFKDKTFFISTDYALSDRLAECIEALISLHGGSVIKEFDSSKIDIYLGQYRQGEAYRQSSQSNRIIVGSLPWFYYVLMTDSWILPINSNLLHYPTPFEPLSEFKGVKIAVTNYNGDARFYLTKLITILGGTYTKSLTRENNYLIVAKPEGKKYETAKNKWIDPFTNKPIIQTVNHLWLEECFANWKFIDPSKPRFQFLGDKNDSKGVEHLIGKTKHNQKALTRWYANESDTEMSEGDDDEIPGDSQDELPGLSSKSSSPVEVHPEEKKTKARVNDFSPTKEANKISTSEDVGSTSLSEEIVSNKAEPATPEPLSNITNGRGRSAKQKAVLKLHESMTDLNNYNVMAKSVTKMKDYMKSLEEQSTKKRSKSEDQGTKKRFKSEEVELTTSKKSKAEVEATPSKKKKPEPQYKVVAVMTGCELELTLNRADVVKLSHIGVKIVNDFSPKHHINTLIAPRILRTEKFLKSLSAATAIIHPNYLIDVLRKLNGSWQDEHTWESISKEFNMDNYSIEKVLLRKELNTELGLKQGGVDVLHQILSSPSKGELFASMKLNLSTNLNGGIVVISSILNTHGLKESKSFKSVPTSSIKQLLRNEDGQIVFIAHATKDMKMIASLKQNCDNVVVVEWDWCVKSIFKMQLEDFKEYEL